MYVYVDSSVYNRYLYIVVVYIIELSICWISLRRRPTSRRSRWSSRTMILRFGNNSDNSNNSNNSNNNYIRSNNGFINDSNDSTLTLVRLEGTDWLAAGVCRRWPSTDSGPSAANTGNTYVYIYIYICVCTYINIYIYIYIHT